MRLELSTIQNAAPTGTPNTLMAQLRVGAIVEAIAVRDIGDGQLWLNIGASRIPARIASGDANGPANGERLQLRVLRDHPVLALETIEVVDSEAAIVSDGLRRFLPRQSSPAPLLSNLAWLATPGKENLQLDRTVREAAQKLWQALPDAQELSTPEGLANAVKRSGTFLETNLSQGDALDARNAVARDVKALLLNLKQTLMLSGANSRATEPPVPGPLPAMHGTLAALSNATASLATIDAPVRQLNELAAQTEGALARLHTVQLVNSEAAPNAAWLLELPFKRDNYPETIRFRFARHSSPEFSAEQSWTVEAALNLGDSGTLHARVSLYGKRVGVQLRAEPPALVEELSSQTPMLAAILRDAGLQVERVVCMHGMPADDGETRAASLLDVRA